MKTIGSRELRDAVSDVIDQSQRAPIVITRHGAPAAIIVGVEGMERDEIELGVDDRLWRELEERRHRPQLVPLEDAERAWGLRRQEARREAVGEPAPRRPKRR
jgi:prevent-host-death family protein